jgi:hypothetical protein
MRRQSEFENFITISFYGFFTMKSSFCSGFRRIYSIKTFRNILIDSIFEKTFCLRKIE